MEKTSETIRFMDISVAHARKSTRPHPRFFGPETDKYTRPAQGGQPCGKSGQKARAFRRGVGDSRQRKFYGRFIYCVHFSAPRGKEIGPSVANGVSQARQLDNIVMPEIGSSNCWYISFFMYFVLIFRVHCFSVNCILENISLNLFRMENEYCCVWHFPLWYKKNYRIEQFVCQFGRWKRVIENWESFCIFFTLVKYIYIGTIIDSWKTWKQSEFSTLHKKNDKKYSLYWKIQHGTKCTNTQKTRPDENQSAQRTRKPVHTRNSQPLIKSQTKQTTLGAGKNRQLIWINLHSAAVRHAQLSDSQNCRARPQIFS